MTHIVLAVDDDVERARLQAERVIDLDWNVVEATVLHVFTENREGASVSQFGPAREARKVLEAAGIEARLAESSGDPADSIVAYAEREADADLLCVAGRSRTPAGKAVFGSVSQSVMLNTDIPVLFCPVTEAD